MPRVALVLVLLALAMSWLYGMIDYAGAFAEIDLRHYRVMAHAAPELAPDVPRPFAHRVLGPWLVGLVPLPDPLAFRAASTLFLTVATLLLFGFLREVGLRRSVAAFTAGLFTLNPYWFGFIAFNPFQVADAIALVTICGAFVAIRREKLLLYGLIVAVGVLAREPVLLVVPAAAVLAASAAGWRWPAAVPWIAAGLPALAAFVLLRILIPAPGPGFLGALLAHADKAADPATWYRLLINSYAPLSLLPVVFWRTTLAFITRNPDLAVFGLLVFASAFLGGDQERLMAPAFVTAYALAGWVIERHLWRIEWMPWLIAAAAFATSLHHLTARFPLPSQSMTIAISLAALILVTGAALWVGQHRKGLEGRSEIQDSQ